jgi:hypothetical protein
MIFMKKNIAIALLGLAMATPALAAPGVEPREATTQQEQHEIAAHIAPQAGIENIRERRATVTAEPLAPLTMNLGSIRFTLSGLLEVEAGLVHIEGGEEEDDLRLSTVQLGLDAEFTPWLRGHVIGLWEEDATEPMVVDEAVLSLTSPWSVGGHSPALHLGRQYLPFGRFDSAMISDPLTLELGETHTTAVLLTLDGAVWNAALGTFTGAVDAGDNGLDSWVLAIEATPREGITLGASWISDLAESDAGLVADERLYRDDVPGWSAFLALQHGDVALTAEYLAAVKRFKTEQVEAGEDLTGRRPQAWNLELAWQATEQLQVAGRYEEALDYQADVRRYGATLSYGLCDFALLAFEYLHANASGTAAEHTFTTQLAVEF